MTSRISLAARVVLIVTLALAAGGAGIGWLVFRAATEQAHEVFDGQMVQSAELLAALAEPGQLRPWWKHHGENEDEEFDEHLDEETARRGGILPREVPLGRRFRQRMVYQVWTQESTPRQIVRSPNAPDLQLPASRPGFSVATWQGAPWRFFLLERRGRTVIVGQDAAVRDRLVHEIGEHGFTPLAIGFGIVILLAWGAIVLGLRPLSRLADEVAALAPDRLEPFDARKRPRELEVLVTALNALFGRVARAFTNERRFTADAAHELRTPLAALAAQIQSADSAPDPQTRHTRLQHALAGTQRMARLVEQLLAAARLDALDAVRREAVDVAQLARDLAADMAAAALAHDVELALEAPEHLMAQVQPDLLRALLRNLIDNAVRHSPAGADVTISLQREAHRLRLAVADEGEGIEDALAARIGERFVRGDSAAGSEGAGLGLSIVRRIAALHGGTVSFERGRAGACVVAVLIEA